MHLSREQINNMRQNVSIEAPLYYVKNCPTEPVKKIIKVSKKIFYFEDNSTKEIGNLY